MSIFLLVDIYTSLLIGVEFLPVWRGISPRLAWNFSHLNPQIVGAVAHKSLKKREKGKNARACMRILLILILNIRAKSLNDLKVVRAGGANVEKDRAGHGPKHHRGTSWMSLSQAGNAPACSVARLGNFKGSRRLRRRLKGKRRQHSTPSTSSTSGQSIYF